MDMTLSIASSYSVNNGFLKERNVDYIPLACSTDLAVDNRAKVFLMPEWDDADDEYDWPWTERGWKMQEELLPHRSLHYTAFQITWKD